MSKRIAVICYNNNGSLYAYDKQSGELIVDTYFESVDRLKILLNEKKYSIEVSNKEDDTKINIRS